MKIQYSIILLCWSVFFGACNKLNKTDKELTVEGSKKEQADTLHDVLKRKELELKEKELQLKERELEQKDIHNPDNRGAQKNYDYSNIPGIYPQASKYKMTASELYGMSRYDLRIMRNEIYARHGYIFKTNDMRDYFINQNWYQPSYDDVTRFLTPVEKYNIELIKDLE